MSSNDVSGPDAQYDILLAVPKGIPRGKLVVDYASKYNRIPHPDVDLEASISKTWESRVAAQPSLYNGTKFRLGGIDILDDDDATDGTSPFRVCLQLALTDYRTFIGTNLNPKWENFLVEGSSSMAGCCHVANPLGNAAVVETADGLIITLQRGSSVGEAPGCSVFPGGHSEPTEVGIIGNEAPESTEADLNRRIADEMCDGIVREVVEETGVPAESLTDLSFIGVVQRCTNIRPVAAFRMKCSLASEEVLQHYKGAAHAFESTRLRCVPLQELPELTLAMPGCHKGVAALYELALLS